MDSFVEDTQQKVSHDNFGGYCCVLRWLGGCHGHGHGHENNKSQSNWKTEKLSTASFSFVVIYLCFLCCEQDCGKGKSCILTDHCMDGRVYVGSVKMSVDVKHTMTADRASASYVGFVPYLTMLTYGSRSDIFGQWNCFKANQTSFSILKDDAWPVVFRPILEWLPHRNPLTTIWFQL